jgi:cytochrome c heme-lyase
MSSKCPVPHDQRANHPMLASFRHAEEQEAHAAPSPAPTLLPAAAEGVLTSPPDGASNADGGTRPSTCPVPHEQRATHPLFRPATNNANIKEKHPTAAAAAAAATAEAAGTESGGGRSSGGDTAAGVALDPSTSANMMHAPNQRPAPGQKWLLPTERQRSSIPRGDFVPGHQEDKTAQELAKSGGKTGDGGEGGEDKKNWVYPSEQMFFNAMNRKGWGPKEEDMPVVIKIHNAVNERTWMEVMKWEAMHAECNEPKLFKFMGRPKDLSPKARVNELMGYKKPFDRHDWVVDRCGQHVRYIIDFYEGNVDRTRDGRQGFFLDTRPALDSPGAFVDRLKMWWHKL